jgi:hypothetical protein
MPRAGSTGAWSASIPRPVALISTQLALLPVPQRSRGDAGARHVTAVSRGARRGGPHRSGRPGPSGRSGRRRSAVRRGTGRSRAEAADRTRERHGELCKAAAAVAGADRQPVLLRTHMEPRDLTADPSAERHRPRGDSSAANTLSRRLQRTAGRPPATVDRQVLGTCPPPHHRPGRGWLPRHWRTSSGRR